MHTAGTLSSTDNSSQIEELVAVVHALAIREGDGMSLSHIRKTLKVNGEFFCQGDDTSSDDSLYRFKCLMISEGIYYG
jgi:hypothetical protein